ncbi:hypothetical protein [Citreimonas sp.]|uniref:DUF7933 domain-containing protein n=1 Tax=Citreimonas sp. TaxID=3036715 RepID=UPI0035C7C9D9
MLRSSFGRRVLAGLFVVLLPGAALAQPAFDTSFEPATISFGTNTRLVYTIDNTATGSVVTDAAFVNNLPASITVADGAVVNTCNGTLNAPVGNGTVSYSGGQLGTGASCTISFLVTAGTPGPSFSNTTGSLTSSLGDSGTASATLTVVDPGVTAELGLDRTALSIGQTTTLTLTAQNPTGTFATGYAPVIDLPSQLEVAPSPNATTTCTNATVTATAGGSQITSVGGFLMANTSCVITVAVRAAEPGDFDIAAPYSVSGGTGGIATLSGSVETPPLGAVSLLAETSANIVNAGDTVDVTYTLVNNDSGSAATDMGFTQDLDAALTGLVATGLPLADPCGAGSSLTGTSVLSLTGATLAPRDRCSFTVTLAVPSGAASGDYDLTTSPLTGTLGGTPFSRDGVLDTLTVRGDGLLPPTVTKTFQSDAVAGFTVDVEFTVSNPNSSAPLSAITVSDLYDPVMLTATTVPPFNFCGPSSSPQVQTTPSARLTFLNMTLAAGTSCTFMVTYRVPDVTGPGDYTMATSEISVTADGGVRVIGPGTADVLTVVGTSDLRLSHTVSPHVVSASGQITATFVVENTPEAAEAGSARFDYDLGFIGASPADVVSTDTSCTSGGSASIASAGGSIYEITTDPIAPGERCEAEFVIDIPDGTGAGSYVSSSGAVTLSDSSGSRTASAASATVEVSAIELLQASATVTPDPAAAGATVTVTYALTNPDPVAPYTNVRLNASLGSLPLVGAPVSENATGCTFSSASPTNVAYIISSLDPLQTCTIERTMTVTAAAAEGDYPLVTTVQTDQRIFDPLRASLQVLNSIVDIDSQFAADTVAAGGTVELTFQLANTSALYSATQAGFTADLDAVLPGATATPVGAPLRTAGTGSCAGAFTGGGTVTAEVTALARARPAPSPLTSPFPARPAPARST